jgi:hypothetical protein
MIPVGEIERVLSEIKAERAKEASTVWTIDQPFWPFGSRQRRVAAARVEILRLLVQSDISAFLVIDEEDAMVRVPHAHRVERDSTWQLEPCIMLGDLITGPFIYGNWSLYVSETAVDPSQLPDTYRLPFPECMQRVRKLRLQYLLQAWPDETHWRLVFPS